MRASLVALLLMSTAAFAKGTVWSATLAPGDRIAGLPVPTKLTVDYFALPRSGIDGHQWTEAWLVLPVATNWCGVAIDPGTRVMLIRRWPIQSEPAVEGTFLGFDVAKGRTIDGRRIAPGSSVVIECDTSVPGGGSTRQLVDAIVRTPVAIGDHKLPARSRVSWHASAAGGGIRTFTTPEKSAPWVIAGITLPPGTDVLLHPNGRLAMLTHPRSPAETIQTGKWSCELGESNNEPVWLHDTGELQECFLRGTQTIGRWRVRTDLRLFRDGSPRALTAAAPFELLGRRWEEGTVVVFNEDGSVHEVRGSVRGEAVTVRPGE